jgi:hypothetical protein
MPTNKKEIWQSNSEQIPFKKCHYLEIKFNDELEVCTMTNIQNTNAAEVTN